MYRAFFALPKSIKGSDGQPVNALLGTANLILREVEEYDPRAVVLAWGPDAAHYRVELYEPYHAERPPVPDELSPQWADAPGFFDAFGWKSVISEDLEADDVMHSLVVAEEEAGGDALILTGDRDMYQCVTDHVRVLYMKTGSRGAEYVDVPEVKKRYGIPPELVPDFIALRGDPSDGIPGAKGIGEKTAGELLRKYGPLEEVMRAAVREETTPKVRSALLEDTDLILGFKHIATVQIVKVKPPKDTPLDRERAAAKATELGMNALAKRLAG